jgi:hypothetical protein
VGRWADIVTILVIALGMALHVRFCLVDDRAPSDLGHYYNSFRNTLVWWQQHGEINWRIVDTPYSLLLAAIGTVLPPSATYMEAVEGGWLLLTLVGAAFVARKIGGPVAGAIAVVAVVAFPQTHVLTRTHWIHHPETAALVGALALWAWRPALTNWPQVIGVSVLLFLGETIRQTGIPFGVPLGLLFVVVSWREGARARLAPIVVALVGGVAWHGPKLAQYVSNKAASAEGYAKSVVAPWYSIVENLGLPVLIWSVPLALLGLVALRRRGLAVPVIGICLVWIVGGVASVALFNVGPDNFPISGVALAILAGIGGGAFRIAAVPSVVLGIVAAALLQVPPLLSYEHVRNLPESLRTWSNPGPINYLRVYWYPIPVDAVLPVVDQVCAETRSDPMARCFILASRGLFNPSWEDGGTFALFLAGRLRSTVLTPEVIWDDAGRASGVTKRVHALVDVRCAQGVAPSAGGRFQAQTARMQAMLATWGGTPIATFGDPKACTQTWYAVQTGGALVE